MQSLLFLHILYQGTSILEIHIHVVVIILAGVHLVFSLWLTEKGMICLRFDDGGRFVELALELGFELGFELTLQTALDIAAVLPLVAAINPIYHDFVPIYLYLVGILHNGLTQHGSNHQAIYFTF